MKSRFAMGGGYNTGQTLPSPSNIRLVGTQANRDIQEGWIDLDEDAVLQGCGAGSMFPL
jgi:hypothetical protein